MKRNITLISIAAVICILISILAFSSCNQDKEHVDISGATDLSGLAGATIAAQSGTFHLDALNTLDNVTVKEYEDFSKLLVALKSGAIDGYVAEEPTALSVIEKDPTLAYLPLVNNDTGFTASDADTGIAVAFKSGSDMVEKVNPIIAELSTETRAALMEFIVKISANPDAIFSGEIVDIVDGEHSTSNGTLRIAMECNYAPFNWTQTTSANNAAAIKGTNMYANGYDVQVARYIAAKLGMALEIYAVEWESLIPGLQAGTYDGIIAGMSPTAEREEQVDFTDCYYNSNLVIIYKKAN